MQLTWEIADIVTGVRGQTTVLPKNTAKGISIDSRATEPGDLFVAIEGLSLDGHDFVSAAFERGAVAAIVSRKPEALEPEKPLILVEDTFEALRSLGRAGRARSGASVVGVTGSVGKTSSKEMLKLALSAVGDTYANEGSLNNHWGVPLSLSRLPDSAQFAVFELGMNHAGELGPLSRMVQPHVALITNVEAVHLEFFPSIEAIADAKAEVFQGLQGESVAVLNRDNPHFARLAVSARLAGCKRIISFGVGSEADSRLIEFHSGTNGSLIDAVVLGRRFHYSVGAPGAHLALNSVAVLGVAAALEVDIHACAAALADYGPPPGRGVIETFPIPDGEVTVIDESYNASPVAVHAAICVLSEFPAGAGRRIMALGDMKELGANSPRLHAELANHLEEAGIDRVYCCGPLMLHLFEALPSQMRGMWTEASALLAAKLAGDLAPGDVITVKGSKVMDMYRVLDAVRALRPEGS